MELPAPMRIKPESWLYPTSRGLYCEPGDFHIDPHRPVDRAVVTHGHADHARPGNRHVLATPETLEIMKLRYGPDAALSFQAVEGAASIDMSGVTVRLVPAGHILGSAQVVLEHGG